MVVFTCQNCGESLKKPQVEKHFMIRPGCKHKGNLTCVDCLKDFIGDEYVQHKQCVSEAQRYAAKGTVIKEPAGQSKQAKYVELIQGLLDSTDLKPVQRNLLTVIVKFDNVPRKWPKFKNFSGNIMKKVRYNENDLKSVFDLIEGAWLKVTQAKNTSDKNSPEKNEAMATSPEGNGHTHDELEKSPQNVDNNESKKGKKKNHKDKDSLICEKDTVGGEDSAVEDEEMVVKTKKKKHKNKDDSLICEKDTVGGEDRAVEDEEMVVENGNDADNPKEITNGVSKKELKKQKKYKKYLAELESVTKTETNNDMEVEENHKDEIVGEDDNSGKKSKKKSKKSKVLVDSANYKPAAVNKNEDSMEVENSEIQKKKKKDKKRKLDDSSCEIAEKRAKETSEGDALTWYSMMGSLRKSLLAENVSSNNCRRLREEGPSHPLPRTSAHPVCYL